MEEQPGCYCNDHKLYQPTCPARDSPLDRTIATCIAKGPEQRWSTAHDVVLQLTMIANSAADPAKLLLNTSTRCMTSIKPRTLRPAILIMPDNRNCWGRMCCKKNLFCYASEARCWRQWVLRDS
jgi:hypothetical protein